MIIYFIPILFLFLANIDSLLYKKHFSISLILLIFFTIVVIAGFRFYSDVDFPLYISLFNETPKISEMTTHDMAYLYGEPGYLIFTAVLREFELDFFYATLLFSFLSILLKLIFLFINTRASLITLSLSIYLCLSFVTVEFIELRWSLASSLIIVALGILINSSKIFLPLVCIMLASMVHYFSIVFIFIYLIPKFKIKFAFITVIFCFTVALYFNFIGISFQVDQEFDNYVLRRFIRYLNERESGLGLFSFLKVLFYISSFYVLTKFGQTLTSSEQGMLKASLMLLAFSLFCSFIPLLYYRAMVIADFISVVTLLLLVSKVNSLHIKHLGYIAISFLFSIWGYIDVNNYIDADRITRYQSWIFS